MHVPHLRDHPRDTATQHFFRTTSFAGHKAFTFHIRFPLLVDQLETTSFEVVGLLKGVQLCVTL
jgi:hypothetical protein